MVKCNLKAGFRFSFRMGVVGLLVLVGLAPVTQASEFSNGQSDQMATSEPSKEAFDRKMNTLVWPFYYATAMESEVVAADGLRIRMAHFEHPQPQAHLFFVTGINDSYLRNIETIFDLYQLGFSVTSYDHRSQGGSGRTSSNRQMVHIDHFSDYVSDLSAVIEATRPLSSSVPRVVVSASMGGGIVAQYIMQNPHTFSAAAFAVPMFGFNTEPYPNVVAYSLTAALCAAGRCAQYAPGQTDHAGFKPFEEQTSMHSPERYQFMIDFYAAQPDFLVGGKSNGWVRESLNATREVRRFRSWPAIPTVVFSAELEDTVLNPSHRTVCSAMPLCELVQVEGAFHDLFNESDSIRNSVFSRSAATLLRGLSRSEAFTP
jgi:lysophospholipase